MSKQIYSIFVLILFAIYAFKHLPEKMTVTGEMPAPIEIVQKKKDRKKFKQERKEYYERMHLTEPGVNWRAMDEETRRQKALRKTEIRRKLSEQKLTDEMRNQFRSRDLEGFWQEKGSNNLAGRIHTADIDFENELIYCGSSGGNIWRGTINGDNWESLNDYIQLPNIILLRVVDNGVTRRLLIGTGSTRFYYTDNEGYVIEEASGLENIQNGGNIKRVVVKNDPANSIYILASVNNFGAGTNTAIYKSVDLGESFSPIWTGTQNLDRYDIWSPRYMENPQLYVQNNGNLSILNDNGDLSFVGSFNSGQNGGNRLTGGVQNGEVFLYARTGEELWFSDNGGMSWEERNHPNTWLFAINSFNSSNIDPDLVAMGGIDVYRSQNGGSSWSLVNNWWEYYDDMEYSLHADIPEIRWFVDPDGNEFALISTDGGLYYANQNLTYVDNLSLNGLGVSQYYSTYTNTNEPHLIWAGAQDQGIQRSITDDDGVLDFTQLISGDYGHLSSSDGGQTIWFVYPGLVTYMTTPGNFHVSWNFQGSGYLWIPPLIEHPFEPNLSYLAGGSIFGGNHIIKLTAYSNYIDAEEMPQAFNGTLSALAYSPIDQNHMYALTSSGYFYHSENGGWDWDLTTGFNGPDGNYLYGSTILPSETNLGRVIVGGSGYSSPPVFISENHGESFESMSDGIPNTMVFALAGTLDDNLVFAATEVGPYLWQSATQEWEDLSGLGAPDQTYWSVEYVNDFNTARFGTYGRGIWDFVVTSYSNVMAGDVNGDMNVNIQDIILVINFVLNQSIPDDDQFEAADFNQDELINVADIILIVDLILNN